jgi:hypothetical protein
VQEDHEYHAAAAYVYIGQRALTLAELWDGVDHAEAAGIPLAEIGIALAANWTAAATALALRDTATLRVLIDEASQ